jgi:hypothetical protein
MSSCFESAQHHPGEGTPDPDERPAPARIPERGLSDEFEVPSAESKFVGRADLESVVLAWLRHLCLPDPTHPDAIVSSLYYDTPSLDAYREKLNGDFIKTKCRLRWYDPELSADPSLRRAFLEIKHKIGRGRRKTRVQLEVDRNWLETAGLDDPGFLQILSPHSAALGERLPAGLAPAAVVRYRRRRFICPFTLSRVCLDTAIGFERINERLLPRLGPSVLGAIVVEIKGGGRVRIPWMPHLHDAGMRERSYSKYGACIAALIKEG